MTNENPAVPMDNPKLPLPELYRGKVRHMYRLGIEEEGEELLLLVASDRISAFDVVLPTPIPHKGRVLNEMSTMWFEQTKYIVPNHFVALITDKWLRSEFARAHGLWDTDSDFIHTHNFGEPLKNNPFSLNNILKPVVDRAMIVKRADRIDVECIVRGYLAGSAWDEYKEKSTVWGQELPIGLKEGERFPGRPLFTPTTKAEHGHDEPMSRRQFVDAVGAELATQIACTSVELYMYAHGYAKERGLILADTKMEFGLLNGQLTLIDELFTPDSSRFWDASQYEPGRSQPSFDKQFVRDWLTESGWDKEPPAPKLPPEIVEKTSQKYLEAWNRLKNLQ